MSQQTHEVIGLGESAVVAVCEAKDEPTWLRELRYLAFATYQVTPQPTLKDEEWRRTDIRGLRWEAVRPYIAAPAPVESLDRLDPRLRQSLDLGDQSGGLLVQQDTGVVFSRLAENLARQGVIFTDLETAVRKHPDLVKQYLSQGTGPEYSRLSALNLALWSGGVFLYVPRRVEVALPLQALNYVATPGLGSFGRTLIVTEADSDVTLVDQWTSPSSEGQQLAVNVQEVFVGSGARVRYVTLQEWGSQFWNFSINRSFVGRDATVNSLVAAVGGRFHKANVECLLRGPGATAEMLGVLFGDERQFFDHHTLQDHQAPHTSSDLLYKGALTDRARSVFSGMIHARPTAQKTDAIQTNRNLLLSDDSRADSIPNLEIEANDLRCTHAATVAPVDEEQLFYLESRGLTPADAKRAIVEGFFEPVLERIPLVGIVDRLRATISDKMGA